MSLQAAPEKMAVKFFQSQRLLINRRLKQLFSSKTALQKKLFEAARYALFPGGKRVRPLLVLATVKTCLKNAKEQTQAIYQAALDAACALEMVHVYSLVHDDLPSMDNDDLRHGKKALHKAYPEWLALLTGDLLLTKAFETISQSPHLKSRGQKLQLIQILAQYAGAKELLAGQYIDLSSEGKKITIADLKSMHLKKTASLITAAVEFGAILASLPAKELKILRNFAQKLGLSYQIVDDLLETGFAKNLGKPQNSDKKKQKASALKILGLKKARKEADKLYFSALEELNKLSVSAKLLRKLADKMINRNF